MKQLLYIVTVGLFLCSNAFSKVSEKQQSIINCADKSFLSLEFEYLKELTSLYIFDSEILKLNEDIDKHQQRIKKIMDNSEKNTAEWISKNPSPLTGSGMEKLKNWINEKDKIFNRAMALALEVSKEKKKLEVSRDILIRERIKKEVPNMTASSKAQKFDKYFDKFIGCERMYNEFPESFKIKYLN